MVVYNVTIKVETSVCDEWVDWMKAVHMPSLMSTGLFTENRLSRLLEQDETDGVTFSAQYVCNSITEYNRYIDEHSEQMRQQSFERFGGKFVAFRSIMEVV